MTLLVEPMLSAAPLDRLGGPLTTHRPAVQRLRFDAESNGTDQVPSAGGERQNEPIRKDAYREIHKVTIHEHDRVSADANSPLSTHALVDRLTAGEPYAVAFGGQGSAWLETLEELVSSAGVESDLATLVGEVELLLEPVAKELVVVRPIGFEPLNWVRALAAEDPVPSDKHLTSAAVSIPGVLLTQIAAVRALARQGMDLNGTPPVAVAGHSQGVLAVEAFKAAGARDAELLALAQLIGAAGTLVARRRGISILGDRPPMVSVTNADPERIRRLLDEFAQDVRTVLPPVLSIRNGRRSVVITGTPEQLSRF